MSWSFNSADEQELLKEIETGGYTELVIDPLVVRDWLAELAVLRKFVNIVNEQTELEDKLKD